MVRVRWINAGHFGIISGSVSPWLHRRMKCSFLLKTQRILFSASPTSRSWWSPESRILSMTSRLITLDSGFTLVAQADDLHFETESLFFRMQHAMNDTRRCQYWSRLGRVAQRLVHQKSIRKLVWPVKLMPWCIRSQTRPNSLVAADFERSSQQGNGICPRSRDCANGIYFKIASEPR